jgi:hypothetical protein
MHPKNSPSAHTNASTGGGAASGMKRTQVLGVRFKSQVYPAGHAPLLHANGSSPSCGS